MEKKDRDRMTESRDELARMLGEDELRDAVLLVLEEKKHKKITSLGQFCATIWMV